MTSVARDVEKGEPLPPIGETVNGYGHFGKQYGGSSKQLKIELT